MPFPVHTPNLFQALDLMFFGVLEKLKASATSEFDDDSVKVGIRKLSQADERTATSSTRKESFRKARFRVPDGVKSDTEQLILGASVCLLRNHKCFKMTTNACCSSVVIRAL
jgi:hypothetical protein